ncbi:hypothetical protein ASPZODRAFT_1507409 [Penicilliopsis zonata CBS 506.65]|uniref:Uncharacterized protein n=1 Tax=Penicilliopsis zonata CBS 506.65 TaxID=1073090 RepID=A0A1L9SLC9_9EURO|nr:hypothetical protein ASPZODRAFT_1507409 [Penicilliopsis zonata CBS 506.65]OJJ48072.1 hypothetical protein ASPZODRAFT_1507409 [Penicilliopsis zonata CBS 506.65]
MSMPTYLPSRYYFYKLPSLLLSLFCSPSLLFFFLLLLLLFFFFLPLQFRSAQEIDPFLTLPSSLLTPSFPSSGSNQLIGSFSSHFIGRCPVHHAIFQYCIL